ncbi:MAG: SDR family oxidoreductase [Acidobacteriota bacterium]|nr:SDR family oxidoreductase [Acidobacteriota bacterium]MDH3523284.1 SDR family oxidoreductase [Acidobacteriota bacterium]
MDLEGKSAIVTGASSGIGAATARALAAAGVRVALAARRVDRLAALRDELTAAGGEALAVATDVTRRADVEALAAATTAAYGGIDVLVNNAGIMPLSFMKNLHVEEWERMVDVNVKGVLYGIAAVLTHMRERGGGHIVNVSSVAGRRVFPSGAVYCGTKFAVNAISEGLRAELSASDGIRVTAIEPGAVATELLSTITDPAVREMLGARSFRALAAEDVARAVLYAVSQPAHVDVAEVLVMPTAQS